MDNNKVVRIGITEMDRLRNKYGEGFVDCEVSGGFIVFERMSGNSMKANIMTHSDDGKDRKLCELVLDTNKTLNAIQAIMNSDN